MVITVHLVFFLQLNVNQKRFWSNCAIHRLIWIITGLNPFHHTTILQQTTLNVFCQNIENIHNWMDNIWQKVENIVAKGEICTFCTISSFVTMFSKSCLLQRRQKASIWGKGLKSGKLVLFWHCYKNLTLFWLKLVDHVE